MRRLFRTLYRFPWNRTLVPFTRKDSFRGRIYLPSLEQTIRTKAGWISIIHAMSSPETRSLLEDFENEAGKSSLILPHYRQHHNWDCGIACLKMVLSHLGLNENDELSTHCERLGLKTSIWSIDLAYILAAFGIDHKMFTLTLGVDENYQSVGFYAEHLNEDNSRVNALFRDSSLHNVRVAKESVETEAILRHLENGQIVVVLVDWKRMDCLKCNPLYDLKMRRSVSELGAFNAGYQGHFICLTGVNRERSLIYFSNPSSAQSVCVSRFVDFEAARKAYGTDEDIIFIYN